MLPLLQAKPDSLFPLLPVPDKVPNRLAYAYRFTEQFGQLSYTQEVEQFFSPEEGGLIQKIYESDGSLKNVRHFGVKFSKRDFDDLMEQVLKPFAKYVTQNEPLLPEEMTHGFQESLCVLMPKKTWASHVAMPLLSRFSERSAAIQVVLQNTDPREQPNGYEHFLAVRSLLDKAFYNRVPRREVKVDTSYHIGKNESLLLLVNDFVVDTIKDYACPNLRKCQDYLLADQYQIKVVKACQKRRKLAADSELLFERKTVKPFSKIEITPAGIDLEYA